MVSTTFTTLLAKRPLREGGRFSFDEFLHDIHDSLAPHLEQHGIALVIDAEAVRRLTYNGDRKILNRLLTGLILNAVPANDGGVIYVSFRHRSNGLPGGNALIIDVVDRRDEGQKEDDSAESLEMDEAAELAARMGGRLEARSKRGLGSAYSLFLPGSYH